MKTLITLILLLIAGSSFAQKYFTRNGTIRFFSSTPLENIEAVNKQASCLIDLEKGEIVAKVLIEAFQFEKALMQEHFNENYMESELYPGASFKAKLVQPATFDPASNQKQEVALTGDLNIHNITQKVTIRGTVQRKGDTLEARASFIVKPEDYQIKIPALVRNNIAKEIEISIMFELKEFKQ
jgi:hypothetical protein